MRKGKQILKGKATCSTIESCIKFPFIQKTQITAMFLISTIQWMMLDIYKDDPKIKFSNGFRISKGKLYLKHFSKRKFILKKQKAWKLTLLSSIHDKYHQQSTGQYTEPGICLWTLLTRPTWKYRYDLEAQYKQNRIEVRVWLGDKAWV